MLVLLFAAPSGPAPAVSLLAGAEDFDLSRAVASRGCADRSVDEIVVCGRRKLDEIVVRDPGRFADRPIRAEVGFASGATLDMHGEQHATPDGRSAPAAMVRLRIPF